MLHDLRKNEMKVFYSLLAIASLGYILIGTISHPSNIPDYEVNLIRLNQNPESWSLQIDGELRDSEQLELDLREFLKENRLPTVKEFRKRSEYALIIFVMSLVSLIIEILRSRSSQHTQALSRSALQS
jgi:preprotein translocase subunit Sss1